MFAFVEALLGNAPVHQRVLSETIKIRALKLHILYSMQPQLELLCMINKPKQQGICALRPEFPLSLLQNRKTDQETASDKIDKD